jgi:DNA-nicking Smr family endonuclease
MEKKHGSDATGTEDEDDPDLFRRLMGDARPLKHSPTATLPRRVSARARSRRNDERDVLRESLEHDPRTAELMSGDGLRYHRQSVRLQTMRKLARGGYSIQSELDLHGMTADEAGIALRNFINECCLRGLSCVRIVHGKGRGSGARGPILKRKVDASLRRWEQVLAYVSAPQAGGGTGAVYVLLDVS